jgi:hypothetical protein
MPIADSTYVRMNMLATAVALDLHMNPSILMDRRPWIRKVSSGRSGAKAFMDEGPGGRPISPGFPCVLPPQEPYWRNHSLF